MPLINWVKKPKGGSRVLPSHTNGVAVDASELVPVRIPDVNSGLSFEAYARRFLSERCDLDLQPRIVQVDGSVPKKFDFVSADSRIVGDAKWYKNVNAPGMPFKVPAAKWSTITEYVWLLQKVDAEQVFLVFGNDIEVPEKYLKKYGALVAPVEFYFLEGTGLQLLSR